MDFKSFDGKIIRVYEWANVENPKGVVQIVHGMVEHATRYEAFAAFLNEHGYIVVADDHRGHGYTDEKTLGYAKGNMFADTVRDEAAITDYFKAKYAELKYFLFGFSYGSFLTQSYLGKYGDKLDGVVLGGSNHKKDFEVYLGSFVAGFVNFFGGAKKPAKFIEKLSFGAYAKNFKDGEWLSIDAESNAKYHADPFCSFTCSYRFYKDFFKGLKKLYTKQYKKGLNKDLPILIASGENDPVGDMGRGVKKLAAFYKKAGVKSVEMKLFEHSRHEFLNEKENREEKWGTLLNFFNGIAD
ncbi:MAG: alpha/beta hydrolase [Clostridiales bacterium]|nr:alpha/beta hydrolase [Clostridiales bacterium]